MRAAQVVDHWNFALDSNLKTGAWSAAEDHILRAAHDATPPGATGAGVQVAPSDAPGAATVVYGPPRKPGERGLSIRPSQPPPAEEPPAPAPRADPFSGPYLSPEEQMARIEGEVRSFGDYL